MQFNWLKTSLSSSNASHSKCDSFWQVNHIQNYERKKLQFVNGLFFDEVLIILAMTNYINEPVLEMKEHKQKT